MNIVKWTGGPNAPANITWARQSLTPILWNGKPNPLLDTDPNSVQWGYTLGGVTYTPRTGVGVDAHGNVMFVVASDATVISLAQILQHIGAVRGMEYDINPEWHTMITYSHHNGLGAKMVEPPNQQSPDRYLTPDDRDFIGRVLQEARARHRPVQIVSRRGRQRPLLSVATPGVFPGALPSWRRPPSRCLRYRFMNAIVTRSTTPSWGCSFVYGPMWRAAISGGTCACARHGRTGRCTSAG